MNVKFVDGVFIMDGFKFICVEFFLNEYGSCIYIVVMYMCFYLFLVLIMVFSYGWIGYWFWIYYFIGDVEENLCYYECNIK